MRAAYAWEVMSDTNRQQAFNRYMEQRGLSNRIDCGNSINPWSPKKGGIMAAYRMFRTAYEEKGLLPRRRDPSPTPAEKAAYLIRNDNHRFPADVDSFRWAAAWRRGSRSPDSCNILNARLATVARYAGTAEQKRAWGEELLALVSGRESYLVKDKPVADPCAAQVYQLAARKTPAQLKAEEAQLVAEEAKRKAAQPLTLA